MRSNKLLFLIFLALYFIAGLSLLITGSVAHRHAKQYDDITGYSLVSGAGFIIALGVIILVLSFVGLVGAYKNRLGLLKLFIGSLIVILLLQLIGAIVAFSLRNRAEDQLRTTLMNSMGEYNNTAVATQWDRLQRTWKCCGVNRSNDWLIHGKRMSVPDSCCITTECKPVTTEGTQYYSDGCYISARNIFFQYSKALGGVSLFFLFVEIAGLVLSILLLRDLQNNYGSV